MTATESAQLNHSSCALQGDPPIATIACPSANEPGRISSIPQQDPVAFVDVEKPGDRGHSQRTWQPLLELIQVMRRNASSFPSRLRIARPPRPSLLAERTPLLPRPTPHRRGHSQTKVTPCASAKQRALFDIRKVHAQTPPLIPVLKQPEPAAAFFQRTLFRNGKQCCV